MTIEHTTAARGRKRTLGVRAWLGAGALTVGVGAALVGAAAVAQADTGDHPSAGSPSSSSTKHEAGPKGSSGVASTKRASAPVAKVIQTPVSAAAVVSKPSASAKPAAASKTATANASLPPINQTINTPFGPITATVSTTFPDIGQSGDVKLAVDATTPIGQAHFSLGGTGTSTIAVPPAISTAQISLTQGTLVVPGPVAFLVNAAGSAVMGGLSMYESMNSFVTSMQSGNVLGAIQAFLEGAPKLTAAVLFGQRTLTLPIALDATSDPVQLNIPIGGVFAPLRPVTLTWTGLSGVQSISGVDVNVTIDPINVAFDGTRFGGAAAGFGQLIGLL